jgi:hypothetical protein
MGEFIKGKGSVGVAIAYYSLRGMVNIPLEPCEYNLVFDNGILLHTVKVISCSYKTKYGIYSASIKTSGGNQPTTQTKVFNPNSCSIVFVVTADMDLYEIPSDSIDATRQISLSKYGDYKVNLIPE